jgi:hypothetical protein
MKDIPEHELDVVVTEEAAAVEDDVVDDVADEDEDEDENACESDVEEEELLKLHRLTHMVKVDCD